MIQKNSDLSNMHNLSNAKKKLLEKRLSGQLKGEDYAERITAYEETGPIPLSFAQERLWFLYQLDPQSPAYNMYNAVQIHGPLDKNILTASFNVLIQRHHILRSNFLVEDGKPYQSIASDINFEIREAKLQPADQDMQDYKVQDLVITEIRRPFDLAQVPLIRALLIKQSDLDHIFVLTIHHIIFDEWSNELLWREISAIYRALLADETPILPELPVQYSDFTIWQRSQIEKQKTNQLAYWKKQLGGELPLIQLPTDRPRPARQTFRGALSWHQLPDSLYNQLKALNQRLSTTVFMSMIAAFQVLLSRYTDQSDILVGTPIANRSRPETKGLIGLFLNTLVLRADLERDISFVEFASQTRKNSLDAYKHQDLPFEILVDELNPRRDMSFNPIFQVMFVHQKSALKEIDLPGIKVNKVPIDIGVAKFDLTLFIQESDDILSVGLEYNSDLFDKETASLLLKRYQVLLESIVEDPQQKISNLQLITDAERKQIVKDWNNTATEPVPDLCIHQIIEAQIAQKSQQTAVVDSAGHLSYEELDKRANQLARYLRKLGVGPNIPVGLILERSTDMVIAILAVLKAGGAYLPLDPEYPLKRLSFILKDVQAPVILTKKSLDILLPDHKADICYLDTDWENIAEEYPAKLGNITVPENIAYIIYTSGSTGTPKGVPVSHRNLVHSTLARDYFYSEPVISFLLLSSFTFDSSIVGIFWTLCQGGKLVLPPQRIEQDISQLARIIREQEITHTLCLPSLYMLLLELADPEQLISLQTVIVAGEECQGELAKRHYDILPQVGLYNEYGPTEGTVWSTAYKIPADFNDQVVPIGKPIPNTEIYILDRYDNLAPIGVPGELCIGGKGITTGYLNAPEMTVQKFIKLSFDGEPPRRLYRTGDRARYLPDGNIEFLGRIDHQVKIRGNRVEMGEIEGLLIKMPTVKEAVVDVRDERLIAYIVPESEPVSSTEAGAFLDDYLPAYMIPTNVLIMDDFPRTPNGKLDRKALPNPQNEAPIKTFVAPSSETEWKLAEIWKNILGIDRLGTHDDFFDLGGNSILSIRVFARIAEQFEVNLPLSVLFKETTIEQLAARIAKEKDNDSAWSLLVPIQPGGEKPPFFCIHGITGDVLWFRLLGQLMSPDQPFYGIQARGLDGVEQPYDSIPEMAAAYLDEIKTVQPSGPYFLGGASLGGTIALEMARQLENGGEEVALLVMFDHAPDIVDIDQSHLRSLASRGKHFTTNTLHWARAMNELGSDKLSQRILRKARVGWKRLLGRFAQENPNSVDAGDLLDYASELPDYRQHLIEAHWHAIKNYRAETYDKPVLLLQARAQPLMSTQNPEATWRHIATDQLTIITVPGSHESMFKEPNVQILARELRAQIDLA